MWRDPLDELIEDLERALPTPSTQVDASMSFVDLQHYVSVALYGTEEDQARAEREPWYQRGWRSTLPRWRSGSNGAQ